MLLILFVGVLDSSILLTFKSDRILALQHVTVEVSSVSDIRVRKFQLQSILTLYQSI